MAKIVVLGSGVIGASVALRLAQAGADVTVLEAARPGAGVSGTSFAWTNANDKPPRPYHDLNAGGMKAHLRLREEFPAAGCWHGGGSIEWEKPERQAYQRERVKLLNSWNYAAEFITPEEFMELEPDIDLKRVGDAPIAYFPEEGYVDSVLYAHTMLAEARRHGATVLFDTKVKAAAITAGRATGVTTHDGRSFGADVVVNCLGQWVNDIVPPELALPSASNVGFLVLTPPVPNRLGRVVRNPVVDVRPDGAGRIMIHCNPTDGTLSLQSQIRTDMREARDMVRRAAMLMPTIAPLEPEAVRFSVRPIPGDKVAVVGPMPQLAGYYVVTTHSGVTQAPFIAELVADELGRGKTRAELADFRPARFFQ